MPARPDVLAIRPAPAQPAPAAATRAAKGPARQRVRRRARPKAWTRPPGPGMRRRPGPGAGIGIQATRTDDAWLAPAEEGVVRTFARSRRTACDHAGRPALPGALRALAIVVGERQGQQGAGLLER